MNSFWKSMRPSDSQAGNYPRLGTTIDDDDGGEFLEERSGNLVVKRPPSSISLSDKSERDNLPK